MKKIITILLFISTLNGFSQRKEVENTINHFFKAFHAKDTLQLNNMCHEKLQLQSITESKSGNTLTFETKSEFYKALVAIPNSVLFTEKIMDIQIQFDGSMAKVWVPYEFFLNKKRSHYGVNVFTLYQEKDTWKIIHLIDTRRKKE